MEEYKLDSCIAFWKSNIGEMFLCKLESRNSCDRHTLAVGDAWHHAISHQLSQIFKKTKILLHLEDCPLA